MIKMYYDTIILKNKYHESIRYDNNKLLRYTISRKLSASSGKAYAATFDQYMPDMQSVSKKANGRGKVVTHSYYKVRLI